MTRRERALTLITGAALVFAAGCIRLAIGVLLDEVAVLKLSREQRRARGPANRDPGEVGRTTDDDGGQW